MAEGGEIRGNQRGRVVGILQRPALEGAKRRCVRGVGSANHRLHLAGRRDRFRRAAGHIQCGEFPAAGAFRIGARRLRLPDGPGYLFSMSKRFQPTLTDTMCSDKASEFATHDWKPFNLL